MLKLGKEFLRFIKHIISSRNLLLTLAYNDFKEQYLGSYLGVFWAILRPSLFILTIWFIFSVGFKRGSSENDVPFVLFLISGYIPWFFFSEAVVGGMNSVVNNRFLVKKVAFRVSILPIVKIISALFQDQQIKLEKQSIILSEPIKKLGIYKVPLRLAPGIESELKVWVVKER